MAKRRKKAAGPEGNLTTQSLSKVLASTLVGALLVFVSVAAAHGILHASESQLESRKFFDDWFGTIFLMSTGVSLAVTVFGWAAWRRVALWLAGKIGPENFDRTAPLRKLGAFVLLAVVGFAIHAVVSTLASRAA